MVTNTPQTAWTLLTTSVTGASHIRSGAPNQDAVLSASVETPLGSCHVIAIADGHGSDKSPRSARGATLATHVACMTICEQISKGWTGEAPFTANMQRHVAHSIVERWREAVASDLAEFPLDSGSTPVSAAHDISDVTTLAPLPVVQDLVAYGTTLLVVAVTADRVTSWQIGDGDMLLLRDNGDICALVDDDPRLLGNSTTSLCTDGAADDFRMASTDAEGPSPLLLLMATDGYRNSFKDADGLQRAVRDFADILRERGTIYVISEIEAWMSETTRLGSGDDITIAIAHRIEQATAAQPDEKAPT